MILTIYTATTMIIIAYLLGSIPSAVWIGKKYYGIDIREHGSKNAGTTNMLRVLGHIFPIFAGFRGGKGVATLVGAVTGIYPPVALLCFGVWFVMLMVSHYVSLSSMVAGCCFPVFTLISPKVNGSTPFVVFSFVIAVLLIYTHRKNIERLKAGTESKIYIWKPRRMNPGDGAERKDKDHGPK